MRFSPMTNTVSEAVAETYAVNNEEDINAVYLYSNGKGNSSSSSRGASSARKHMSPHGFLEEDREDNLDWESRGAGRAAATPNEVPLNSIVGASAQQTTPEALHRVSGVLDKRRGELSSLRPAATLDEFRNSSHGSAKSAINSLLTSERVLRPLRSLIVQSYLQRPERFSLNLGELLTELAEEEQQGARQANSGALGNGSPSSRARQSDAHVGVDAEVAEENPYYLAVDMLEVELANILSTCSLPRTRSRKSGRTSASMNKKSPAGPSPPRSDPEETNDDTGYRRHGSGPKPSASLRSRGSQKSSRRKHASTSTRAGPKLRNSKITAPRELDSDDPLAETVLMWNVGSGPPDSSDSDRAGSRRAGRLAWQPLRERRKKGLKAHLDFEDLEASLNEVSGPVEVDSELHDMAADVDEVLLATSSRPRAQGQRPFTSSPTFSSAKAKRPSTRASAENARPWTSADERAASSKKSQRRKKSSKSRKLHGMGSLHQDQYHDDPGKSIRRKTASSAGLDRLCRDTASTRARQLAE